MGKVTKVSERTVVLLAVSAVVRDSCDGKWYVLLTGGHRVEVTDAEYARLGEYIAAKNEIELAAVTQRVDGMYDADNAIAALTARYSAK